MLKVFGLCLYLFFFTRCDLDLPGDKIDDTARREFSDIAAVLEMNCAACHHSDGNQREFTLYNFKSSSAASRLIDGSMPPPPNEISKEDKDILLTYLEW